MASRPGKNALQIGEWIADPDDDSLTRGPQSQRIEPRSMRVLMQLARTPGVVISQDALLDEVWRDVVVSPASVYQTISQLRKALADTDSPPSYIETVARKGYRLVAPVVALTPQEVAPPANIAPPLPLASSAARPKRRRTWMAAVALLIVTAVLAAAWWRPAPAMESVVVLPFTDMTTDRSEQAFCDGMTEELSNWLAQIPTLRVVSRTSAFAFRGRSVDVREIGRALNTSYVLEGSMRRSGDIIRVTVQLTASRDGFHKWSKTYTETAGDALQLQENIARAVANNLELQFAVPAPQLAQRRGGAPAAQASYILARFHFQQHNRKDNDRAIELYKNALAIDPDFALAQVGLAYAFLNQQSLNSRPLAAIAADAEPLLAAAAQNAPELPELYAVRGALRGDQGREEEALRDLHRALELNPNLGGALSDIGRLHVLAGRPREALSYYDQAVSTDPMNADLRATRCMVLAEMGRFDDADVDCERARSLGPDDMWPRTASGLLEEARGNPMGALAYSRLAVRGHGDVGEQHYDRARWFLRLGLLPEARASYESLLAVAGDDAAASPSYAVLGMRTAFGVGGPQALQREIEKQNLAVSEDPLLLFALAEGRLLGGNGAAARAAVDRALSLPGFDPALLTSRGYARQGVSYLLIAAAADLDTGEATRAEQRLRDLDVLLDQLVADGVRSHALYGLRAETAALRGRADAAMRELRTAINLGWRYTWLAENEPYFRTLRQRADYRALLAEVNARNATEGQQLRAASAVR